MSQKDYFEKDYYKTLGVSKTASDKEIKKTYRKLARELHPDTNPDPKAEARFKEVSEAYDVLSDAAKRAEYDEAREMVASGAFRGAPGGFGGGGFGGGAPGGFSGGTFNANDFGDLGDLFGGLFNRGGGSGPGAGGFSGARSRARRGQDIESEVTLGFSEAVDGVTLPLRLSSEGPCSVCNGTGAAAGTTPRVCPTCAGSGSISRNAGGFAFPEPCPECLGRGLVVDDPCTTCRGSGRGTSTRTVNARIPAGVKDGQKIRLKGKGGPGENGGNAGDLIIRVNVDAHPVFGRKGDNLTLTLPVSFTEAALGATVKVPLLGGGTVSLKLPPGTSNGRTFRVRGKGVRRKDGSTGDLLVTTDVVVPPSLTDEARKALEEYREHTGDADPRATLYEQTRQGR